MSFVGDLLLSNVDLVMKRDGFYGRVLLLRWQKSHRNLPLDKPLYY